MTKGRRETRLWIISIWVQSLGSARPVRPHSDLSNEAVTTVYSLVTLFSQLYILSSIACLDFFWLSNLVVELDSIRVKHQHFPVGCKFHDVTRDPPLFAFPGNGNVFFRTDPLIGWQEEFSDDKAQTVSNRIETDNCWGPNVEQVLLSTNTLVDICRRPHMPTTLFSLSAGYPDPAFWDYWYTKMFRTVVTKSLISEARSSVTRRYLAR